MLLLIDNYDSFTYNLYQYLSEFGEEIRVLRNDAFTIEEVKELNLSAIIISPGPGQPSKAGLTENVVKELSGRVPMLGVCLGHQAIAEVFGAEIVKAKKPMHGKCAEVFHNGKGLFAGLDSPFTAVRYHSLIVKKERLPECFELTARSGDDEIMALRHRELPLFGVQFHPESIMTSQGKKILENFIGIAGRLKDKTRAQPRGR